MDGAPKILNGSHDVTTPLSWKLCCLRSRTSYSQPVHQIKVSMFIHYENMKGDNWGGLGVRGHPRSSETSPFDSAHMTSYSTLIETMHLSCTVFKL